MEKNGSIPSIPEGFAVQKVTIPAEVATRLRSISSPAQLCDESGAVSGVAVPFELYQEMMEAWVESGFSDDDLARARAESGGYSTSEAIEYLNRLVDERGGR